ncbi:MAG: 8-oxo-dGTP diphosphatase [Candidatus Pacebacteria bacterium]|nr:8-oxo-dGTP diphosphatase [Candidatus Paceibacterota bacterium]
MKKQLTLCIIHNHSRVLLGMKKRGFGTGRWNGFGGKVERGETIEEATVREIKEEAGIQIEGKLEKMGILDFEFQKNPEILEVHIFRAKKFSGEPTESEEMRPQWFRVDEIPYKEMWPDDIYWIPLFLKKKKFIGKFLFGEGDSILEQRLEEIENNINKIRRE